MRLPHRTHKPKHATVKAPPVPTGYDWAIRDLDGAVTASTNGSTLWFVLRDVPWSYRSNQQNETSITAAARAWVALSNREIHLRSLTRPYPVSAWARNLDMRTPNPVNPAAWSDHLRSKQRLLRGASLGDTITFIGVTLTGTTLSDSIMGRIKGDAAARATVRRADEIAELTSELSSVARVATQREVEWLLHQSRGLTLPSPAVGPVEGQVPMDVYDLAGVFDAVEVTTGLPGARTITIAGSEGRNGVDPIERHVAILSVGRMEDLMIPERHVPWLAKALQFPGAEISVRIRIIPGPDAARAIQSKIDLVQDQEPQYRQHGLIAPPNLSRVLDAAVKVQDQMQEGHASKATRAYVQARIAVSGRTRDEAMARATKLRKHFEDMNIRIEHPAGQEGLYREFVPEEPLSTSAHTRRMEVRTLAAAMPNIAVTLGDRQGDHLGRVRGVVPSPFVWDLHRGMESGAQSGLTPVVGGLGSGKSNAIGGICTCSGLRGIWTTVLDPSGPLARIVGWPPLEGHAAAVDLLRSPPGSLSPFAVIPDPPRAIAENDDRVAKAAPVQKPALIDSLHADNLAMARIERKALALDTLRACLPRSLAGQMQTDTNLMKAIRVTEGRKDASIGDILAQLKVMADGGDLNAAMLYEALTEVGEHPYARLFFAPAPDSAANIADATLLVLTLTNLRLPTPGSDPALWSTNEQLSVPLLNLAAHFTSARIYSRPMRERKVVALDETHFMAGWASGRALLARLERDSRKWNVRVFTASQDTKTALASQDASRTLISDALVFNIGGADPSQREAALELLEMPHGMGYENVLSNLRPPDDAALPPDKVWRDAMVRINGTVGKVRWDGFRDMPGLAELLLTNPGEANAQVEPAHNEWFPA